MALLTYITFFGSLASLMFLSIALFIFCYFRLVISMISWIYYNHHPLYSIDNALPPSFGLAAAPHSA